VLLKFNEPTGPLVVDGAMVRYCAGEVARFSEPQGRALLEHCDVDVLTQEEVDAECARRFQESEARIAARHNVGTVAVRFRLQTLIAGQLYQSGEVAYFDSTTADEIVAAERGARV